MNINLTLTYKKVPEGYIGYVEELPGANSQGESIEEVKSNLLEAIELIFEANKFIFDSEFNRSESFSEKKSLVFA